ncbi:MAG: hypothetical protein J6Z36_03760 [Clostridia bacterium]|nr:hypothetical protein [Clostridia bacterium]
MPIHTKKEVEGGDPAENAAIMRRVFSGEKSAYRDAVVANSAVCLYMMGKADSLKAAARLAEEVIDSGKAKEKLEAYIAATNEV